MTNTYMIHYGEIALKGRNRIDFERQLMENIRVQHPVESVQRLYGRLTARSKLALDLSDLFGVVWWSQAVVVPTDYGEIQGQTLETVKEKLDHTQDFAIRVTLGERVEGWRSQELEARIGQAVVDSHGLGVDLEHPDLTVYVEIMRDQTYIYTEKHPGPGGLPAGISGTFMGLFSGGIDSAVAAYLMGKRGGNLELVHFYAMPSAASAHASKIGGMLRQLAGYLPTLTVHYFPYHGFQLATSGLQDRRQRYELVVFRRFMARVAQHLAWEQGALGLFTGDNLGQVASQTAENLAAVDDVLDMPIYRPLIAYDKQEIIDLSIETGLYEGAIISYKDCCSIIARHPITSARLELVRQVEEELDVGAILKETLLERASYRFSRDDQSRIQVNPIPVE